MTVPSPKKTLKDLPKKKTKTRRPFSEKRKSGILTTRTPDVVDLTPPEEADQLLLKDGGKVTKMGIVVAWAQHLVVRLQNG